MTFLMTHNVAHFALVALLVEHSPNKVAAVGTERWLSQIRGHEFVTTYFVDLTTEGIPTTYSVEVRAIVSFVFYVGFDGIAPF